MAPLCGTSRPQKSAYKDTSLYGHRPSSNTGGQVLSPPAGYLGCYLATSTTTCGTGSSSAVDNPRDIQIDSTGSVWAGITSGGLTQLMVLALPHGLCCRPASRDSRPAVRQ